METSSKKGSLRLLLQENERFGTRFADVDSVECTNSQQETQRGWATAVAFLLLIRGSVLMMATTYTCAFFARIAWCKTRLESPLFGVGCTHRKKSVDITRGCDRFSALHFSRTGKVVDTRNKKETLLFPKCLVENFPKVERSISVVNGTPNAV